MQCNELNASGASSKRLGLKKQAQSKLEETSAWQLVLFGGYFSVASLPRQGLVVAGAIAVGGLSFLG